MTANTSLLDSCRTVIIGQGISLHYDSQKQNRHSYFLMKKLLTDSYSVLTHWALVKPYTSPNSFAWFYCFDNKLRVLIYVNMPFISGVFTFSEVLGLICRVPYLLLFLRLNILYLFTCFGLRTALLLCACLIFPERICRAIN